MTDPHPGWKPPRLFKGFKEDSCMRQAFACVAGFHPAELEFIDPAQSGDAFYREWEELIWSLGWKWRVHLPNDGRFRWPHHTRMKPSTLGRLDVAGDHLWIAAVNSLVPGSSAYHAIVMRGRELYYDSASLHGRKQRPHKIHWGWSVWPAS